MGKIEIFLCNFNGLKRLYKKLIACVVDTTEMEVGEYDYDFRNRKKAIQNKFLW